MRSTYVNSPQAARKSFSSATANELDRILPMTSHDAMGGAATLARTLCADAPQRLPPQLVRLCSQCVTRSNWRHSYLARNNQPRICCLNSAERKVTESRRRAAAVALSSLLLVTPGVKAKAAQELFR